MMVRKLLLGYEPPKSLAVESGQLMPSHFIILVNNKWVNLSRVESEPTYSRIKPIGVICLDGTFLEFLEQYKISKRPNR